MNKEQFYASLCEQLRALLDKEHDPIANMANMSALLYHALENINWLGFYLYNGEELILGPFQGKVACMHIPYGRGVCGSALLRKEIVRVDDVHAFAGHIACDQASCSEIVLPVYRNNCIYGVLDVDSPLYHRFDEADEAGLQALVHIWEQATDEIG